MPAARPAVVALAGLLLANGFAQAADLLVLEQKIPLGQVKGRIDHMAIDVGRKRLIVAELGNDTVGVVDIPERKVVHVITGLKEPQGIGFVATDDTVYVANAGDGSVRIYRAADYAEAGTVDLGEDADNVRVDPVGKRVFVGYGGGAFAIIDAATRKKVSDIPLGAHPEGFQLAQSSGHLFVNIPRRREIAAVDPATGGRVATWPMGARDNFPMTLDEGAQRVIVTFRSPARLGVFSMHDGAAVANVETCGDSDDVFADAKRRRIYVVCGEGFVDVFEARAEQGSRQEPQSSQPAPPYSRVAHIRTAAGARTGLFSADADRLFVAVPARSKQAAAIWAFRPVP